MFEYVSELFSSLLNINAFMRDNSTVSENEPTEKEDKKEDKKEEEKEDKKEEEKEISETFEFIEINDDDVKDMFITKF